MNRFVLLGAACLFLTIACKKDCPTPSDACSLISASLTDVAYNPTAANLAVPASFPPLEVPADNPLTLEGIELGRHLFYDPILSADSTMSCFSCHTQNKNFTDGLATSEGIDNIAGNRSSMALINMAWNHKGFFWDGRSPTLESQALLPVEDSVELHDTWENVICKLNKHNDYPQMFRQAFGIADKNEITRDLAVKALAQFQRSIISGNSRYDKWMRFEIFPTDEESNGHDMYFDAGIDKIRLPDVECAHCHDAPLFTINEFRNNGIEEAATLDDFPDLGLGGFSGIRGENGRFRTPTLRNIEYTAPYMHDGRFETLEEVIDHYSSGGKNSPNKDALIYPLNLDSIQKSEILAFLKMLSEPAVFTKDEYSNPF